MEVLSWRVAREQLLAELHAEADGRLQTLNKAQGEGLRTSQPGANGSTSPTRNPRRGPRENAASPGSAPTGPSALPRADVAALGVAVAQQQYQQLLSQMPAVAPAVASPRRPGSGDNVSEGPGHPQSTQQRSTMGEGTPKTSSVREPQLPYRLGPRATNSGVVENRLVNGDVHIVSTRPRPTRATPIADAAAASSPQYGHNGGGAAAASVVAAAAAEPAILNTSPELPLLPQVQQQRQQHRAMGGHASTASPQQRQKPASISNGAIAAAATAAAPSGADGVVRLPSPSRTTLNGAAGAPLPALVDIQASGMPALPRAAIRRSAGAESSSGGPTPANGTGLQGSRHHRHKASASSSGTQTAQVPPPPPYLTAVVLPPQGAAAAAAAAAAAHTLGPGPHGVKRTQLPKARLDSTGFSGPSVTAARPAEALPLQQVIRHQDVSPALQGQQQQERGGSIGATAAKPMGGSPIPLTTAALALHTTNLHGDDVWWETAAAEAARAAASTSSPAGGVISAAMVSTSTVATVAQPAPPSPPPALQHASLVLRNAESSQPGGTERRPSLMQQPQVPAASGAPDLSSGNMLGPLQQTTVVVSGLAGGREYIPERVRRNSDAAGAVLVLGRPPSASAVVVGGNGNGSWSMPYPIGSIRTSETGDGVRIVANRRPSSTVRRPSHISDIGGSQLAYGSITQASVLASAGPSIAAAAEGSGGSPLLLHLQLQQLQQQYGHLYLPSPPRQGSGATEAPPALPQPPQQKGSASGASPPGAYASGVEVGHPLGTQMPDKLLGAQAEQQQPQQQLQSQPQQQRRQSAQLGSIDDALRDKLALSTAPDHRVSSPTSSCSTSSSASLPTLSEHEATTVLAATVHKGASPLAPPPPPLPLQQQQQQHTGGRSSSSGAQSGNNQVADTGKSLEAWPTLALRESGKAMDVTMDGAIPDVNCGDGNRDSDAVVAISFRRSSVDMSALEESIASASAAGDPVGTQERRLQQQLQFLPPPPQQTVAPDIGSSGVVIAAEHSSSDPVQDKDPVAGWCPVEPVVVTAPAAAPAAVEVEPELPWFASASNSTLQLKIADGTTAGSGSLPQGSVAGVEPLAHPSSHQNALTVGPKEQQGSRQVSEETGPRLAAGTGGKNEGDVAEGGHEVRSPVVDFVAEIHGEDEALPVPLPVGAASTPPPTSVREAEAAVLAQSEDAGKGSNGPRALRESDEGREIEMPPPQGGSGTVSVPRAAQRRTTFAADVAPGGYGDGGDGGNVADPSGPVRHVYVPSQSTQEQSARVGGPAGGEDTGEEAAAGIDEEEEVARRRAVQRRASSARSTASRHGGVRRKHVAQTGVMDATAAATACIGVDTDGDPDAAFRSLRTGLGRSTSSTSRFGKIGRAEDAGGGAGTVAQLSRTAAVVGNAQSGRKVIMDVMVVRPPPRRAYFGERRTDSLNDGGGGGSDIESDDSDLEQLRRSLHPRSGSMNAGAAARSRPMTASSSRSRPTTAKSRVSTPYQPSRPATAHQRPTTASSRRPTADGYADAPLHSHHHRLQQQQQQQYEGARPISAARSVRSTRSFTARPSSARSMKSIRSTLSTRSRRRSSPNGDSDDLSSISDISDLSDFSDVASIAQGGRAGGVTPSRSRPETTTRNHQQHQHRFTRLVKTETGIFPPSEGSVIVDSRGVSRSTRLTSSFNRSTNSFNRSTNSFNRSTNSFNRSTTTKSNSLDRGTPHARARRTTDSTRQGSDAAAAAAAAASNSGAVSIAAVDPDDVTDADVNAELKAATLAKLVATDGLGAPGKTEPSAAAAAAARGPTMAMVREAHAQLQRQKAAAAAATGGGVGQGLVGEHGLEVEDAPLRRQDAGADSYMLRIFGSAYTKVAGGADFGDSGALKVWLHPYSTVRMRLDMLWVVAALLMSAVMPLQIAFTTALTALPYLLACLTCSVAWMAHVMCNFMTGYDEDGIIVMDAVKVRNRYCCTYLLLDVIGALPYALIAVLVCGSVDAGVLGSYTGDGGSSHCSVRHALMLRLWSLLPLATLPRLLQYLSKWQDTWDIDIHMMRLVKLLGTAMIFTHLFACMSYYVQLIEDFPLDGWVEVGGLGGKGAWITYNFALLRALQVVMGSNVDVVSTSSSVEVVFTICSYIVGVVFYTILVGIMSSIVLSLNRSGQMYVEKLQIWRDYCHYRRLPGELRRRVMAYINTAHSNKRVLDDTTMLMELSPGLRTDINLQLCAELVATVPVFLECSPIVVRAIVSKLQRETHVAGDFVFRVGDIADAVYFILKGTVSISDETGALLTKLAQGSHFGEFGILAYLDGQLGVRTAAARADECVELYKLHCEDFSALADYYPELVDFFRDVAVVRSAYNATLRANRVLTEWSGSESGSEYDDEYDDEFDDEYGNKQDGGYRGGDSSQLFSSSSGEDEDYEDLMRNEVGGGSDLVVSAFATAAAAAAAAAGGDDAGDEALGTKTASRLRIRLTAGSGAVRSHAHVGDIGESNGSGDGFVDGGGADVRATVGAVNAVLPPGTVPDVIHGGGVPLEVRIYKGTGGASLFKRALAKTATLGGNDGGATANLAATATDADSISAPDGSFSCSSSAPGGTARQSRTVKFALYDEPTARPPSQPLQPVHPVPGNAGGVGTAATVKASPAILFAPRSHSPPSSGGAIGVIAVGATSGGPSEGPAAGSSIVAAGATAAADDIPVAGGGRAPALLSPESPVGNPDAAIAAAAATGSGPFSVLSAASMLLSALHSGGSRGPRNRVMPQDSMASQISVAASEPGGGGGDGGDVVEAETERGASPTPRTSILGVPRASWSKVAALSRGKTRQGSSANLVAAAAAMSGSSSTGSVVSGTPGASILPNRGASRLRNISIIAPEDEASDAGSSAGDAGGGSNNGDLGKASTPIAGGMDAAELASSVPMLARMRKVTDVVTFLNAVSRSAAASGGGGGSGGGGASPHSFKGRPGSALGPPLAAALAGTAPTSGGTAPTRVGNVATGGGGGIGGGSGGGIIHGASRTNLILEVSPGSAGGGDDDAASTLHTAGSGGGGGPPYVHGYSRSHSHGQNHIRPANSGDLSSAGSSVYPAATTPLQPPPSRSISNGVSGLLHKLIFSRSNRDQSPASSREGTELSMGYDDGGTGSGTVSSRLDQQHQLLLQQSPLVMAPQSLRRKSVTMGAGRSNASFLLPGSNSARILNERLSHPNGTLPDVEGAAVTANPAAIAAVNHGGGTTGQVTVAAMRLASISAGAGLAAAARLASVSAGALNPAIGSGGGGAAGGGYLHHHHHHHHLHNHNHHGLPRNSGGITNSTRDILTNGAAYHGQHPLGPGVVNLGFG